MTECFTCLWISKGIRRSPGALTWSLWQLPWQSLPAVTQICYFPLIFPRCRGHNNFCYRPATESIWSCQSLCARVPLHAGPPLRTCAPIYVVVRHHHLRCWSVILQCNQSHPSQPSPPASTPSERASLGLTFSQASAETKSSSCCNSICPTYSREFFAQQKSFSWKQDRDSRCCAGVSSVESDYHFGCFSLSIWYGCLGSCGWWCIFKPRTDRNQVSSLYKRNINPQVEICLQHHWQTWNLSFSQNDWSSFLILKQIQALNIEQ